MPIQKTTKALIAVGSAFGIIILGLAITLAVMFLNAPKVEEPTTPDDSSVEQLDSSSIPEIVSFEVIRKGKTSPQASVSVEVSPLKGDLYGEYEVRDINKKSVLKGNLPEDGIIEGDAALLNGPNSFTLRIRVSDGATYSSWKSTNPVLLPVDNLKSEEGINTEAKPNPKYFETKWAKGNASEANLKEAIEIAWNAETVNYETDSCMILNSANLAVGEIIPPLPSKVPEEYKLKYEVSYFDENTSAISFYWCLA